METKSVFYKKIAFVAGATKGTGLELTKLLLKNGAYVLAAGRNYSSEIKQLQSEYKGLTFEQIDFNSLTPAQIIQIPSIKDVLSKIQILAVPYGPFIQKKLEETTAEDWTSLALNDIALPGTLLSASLPSMQKNGFGRIILFGGTRTDSVRSYKTTAAYSACKTALSVLVKSAAACGGQNITCNAILPGFTSNAPENTTEVSADFLARQAFYLMSTEELNGVLLNADRGWTPA